MSDQKVLEVHGWHTQCGEFFTHQVSVYTGRTVPMEEVRADQ